ncbi:MAG: hypothetical protein ACOH5I_18855 [Oligoflexus sp.]
MFLHAIISGIIGSLAMLVVLYLITLAHIANADMVRALGSLITKSLDNSVKVGLLTYFLGGIFFSFIYFAIFSLFPLQEAQAILFIGVFGGFVHGLIVSFALVISVSGRHPVPRFRDVGFGVALAHIIGHIAYGSVLALSYIAFYQPAGNLPTASEIGPYGIYALVVIAFGIVFTVVTAIVTKQYRKKRKNDDDQSQLSRPGHLHQL